MSSDFNINDAKFKPRVICFNVNGCKNCLRLFDVLNYDKDSCFKSQSIDYLSINVNHIIKCCPYCDSVFFEKVFERLMEDDVEYYRR